MYLDVHAIQNVPPSNINRDDTGSPKTALYGGVRRARVSSQAWKHAMRELFPLLLPDGSLGVRTKLAQGLIADRISELRPEYAEQAQALANGVLTATGVKTKVSDRAGSESGTDVTEYLIFIANSELDALAHVAIGWAEAGLDPKKPSAPMKKEVSAVFHGVQAVDIALFGRMLADAPDLNTDASAQVAHAISVDPVTVEYDYFTAVDDCAAEDNAGAAMIDSVGFDSSTLYRYATVNFDSLRDQLGSDEAAARGCAAFIEAFVRSMPSGKMNTFANRTLPSALYVAIRDDQPINAVSAFEEPIRSKEGTSISRQAVQRLGDCISEIEKTYGHPALRAWNVVVGEPVEPLSLLGVSADFATVMSGVHEEILAEIEKTYGHPALRAWNVVVGEPVEPLSLLGVSADFATVMSGVHEEILALLGQGSGR